MCIKGVIILNTYSIKVKLVLTLLSTTLITPLGLLIYILFVENQVQEQQQQLVIRKNQQEKVFFFENSLQNAYSDILYVSRIVDHKISNNHKKNALTFDKKLHADISFAFKNFLEVNPFYQQIRLIDNSGQERIRFNQQQGKIVSANANKLQNKSKYAYVYESLKLQAGEIYISELDLNRENGVIETPYNPTLRIATILDDKGSGFKGIIVINISAQQILDVINKQSGHDNYLINQYGDYIVHPQVAKQWSAPLGLQHNFMTDFPEFGYWQKTLERSGLATFKTAAQQLYVYPIDSGSQFHREWFLITAIPKLGIWNHIQHETVLISTAFIAVFLSILLGCYVSRRWFIQPISYMENISQRLVENKPIEFTNPCRQKDELGSLCKKLHQMAKIISSNQEKKERVIESLTNEISHREKVERDLSIYKTLFECSSEAMMITDSDEIITHINPAYTQITGYNEQEAIGQTPRLTSSGKQNKMFYEHLWLNLSKHGLWQGEIFNRRKNGEIFPVYQYINSIKINNKTAHYISVFSDITRHKNYEETLWRQANYDPLTHLANRTLLEDRLSQTLAKMYRHKHYAALLFMDLDNFKHINDSLGHNFGDDLLKKVATRLLSSFREIDSVSRFGGDEFVILVTDLFADKEGVYEQVKNMVNKLLRVLAKPYMIEQHELFASASIGISVFPAKDNQTPEDIIKMADIAMYAAKAKGKSTYEFYHPDMQKQAHRRLYIEKDLRSALKHNQLLLFYQCQYTDEHELLGMEALIRWQHPEQGLIFPNDFIPIAEESGLIVAIGEVVIRQACLQIKQWEKEGYIIPHIAVNVSPKQFAEKNFVNTVCAICLEMNIPPKQLMLELTEASIITDIENTIKKMSQLQQLGYRISIDDFGTGYSSLAYLKKLPINQLKIDKTFVDDINTENEEAVIVDTIIAMAHHLKLDLIAEGVENKYQINYLMQQGCLGYQGYYFCKPVPATEVFSNKTIKNIKGELC